MTICAVIYLRIHSFFVPLQSKYSLINIVMLTKFAVKNYRGFKNRIEWDLSHPSNYTFNNDAVHNGIV